MKTVLLLAVFAAALFAQATGGSTPATAPSASPSSITLWVLTTPAATGKEVWQPVAFSGFTLATVNGVLTITAPTAAAVNAAAPANPAPTVTLDAGASTMTISTGYARIAGTVYQFMAPQTIAFTGAPTLYVYISDGSDGNPVGTLAVAAGAAAGVTCSASTCLVTTGTGYSGLPLAFFNGTAVTDMRVFFGLH